MLKNVELFLPALDVHGMTYNILDLDTGVA